MPWKGPYTIKSISYSNLRTLKSSKKIKKTNTCRWFNIGKGKIEKHKNEEVVNNIMDNLGKLIFGSKIKKN